MEKIDFEKIGQWLPFLISPLELEDFLANKELYPTCLPLTKKGFYLEAAVLRYRFKREKALTGEEKEVVLTSKFLAAVPNPGLALLLVTDACQPKQILEIYAERGKAQEKLGAVISLTEVDKRKKTLGKIVFSLGKEQTLEIKPEEVIRIMVGEETELALDFRLKGAKVLGKTKARISVSGGQVGIIIDSRGRPIEVGEGEEGWEKIKRWTSVFAEIQ